MKRIRIWFKKRQLGRLIAAQRQFYCDYDCGQAMADRMSPIGSMLEARISKLVDWLKANDPIFPQQVTSASLAEEAVRYRFARALAQARTAEQQRISEEPT